MRTSEIPETLTTTTTTTTKVPKPDVFPEFPGCSVPPVGFYHHDQAFLEDFLEEVSKSHPHLAKRASLPGSVPLHYVRLTKDPGNAHPNRPMFKYVGNMHGDEVVGREMLFHFTRYLLCAHDASDERVVRLLGETDIYIMPTMNPAGHKRRFNASQPSISMER